MYDEDDMRAVLRTRLLTLSVATTGAMSLAATASGFVRTSGSFLTDGFRSGMEVVGTAFSTANNVARLVTGVDTLNLYADGVAAQAAAGSRTLAVGLPLGRSWEGEKFEKEDYVGRPYVEERFIPGPSRLPGLIGNGHAETTPQYQVLLHLPENLGVQASALYSKALRTLFKPGTAMALSGGDNLRVRADTGPYTGQTFHLASGWVVTPVTFPLRLYSLNAA